MNCPSCGNKMEMDNCPEVRSTSIATIKRTGKHLRLNPSAIYRCEDCDAEYKWTMGVKGITLLDSGDTKWD